MPMFEFPITIIILGKDGQVGFELSRSLQPLGNVIALGRTNIHYDLSGDITDTNALRALFRLRPSIIVNAAAYTAVDNAEHEPHLADAVNATAVANLASLCQEFGVLLIHYSTDYVFDGTGTTPFSENDPTNPINRYGASKRLGETALECSGASFINLRTSWVYAVSYTHLTLPTSDLV